MTWQEKGLQSIKKQKEMWKKEEYSGRKNMVKTKRCRRNGKSKKRCGRKKNTVIYLPKREAEAYSCPDWCGVCSHPTPSALYAPARKIQKQEMPLRSCLCLISVPVLYGYIAGKSWKDTLNLLLRIVCILLRCVGFLLLFFAHSSLLLDIWVSPLWMHVLI